ncbi:MAG: lamin tail domain-containing protein [Candidatus Limnocylindrales bacterium]
MDHARRAARTALALLIAVAASGSPGGAIVRPSTVLAAAVAWPASTLVVSEVQTGGASASDEFVEIANQGLAPVDLVGLEVVYATSTGSTVTRKATWSASVILEPGRRTLIANALGLYAAGADGTYSGGSRCHRGRRGPPRRRWIRRGCRRLGRCHERVRRGAGGRRAFGRVQPGTAAGWRSRQRRGYE